jgi:hypothetical protein
MKYLLQAIQKRLTCAARLAHAALEYGSIGVLGCKRITPLLRHSSTPATITLERRKPFDLAQGRLDELFSTVCLLTCNLPL